MARYGLTEVTPPAVEPVTVAEALQHLRLDEAPPELALMIAAARLETETWCGRALITQTWTLSLPWLYKWQPLPLGVVQQVEQVSVDDDDGTTVIDPSEYWLDADRIPAILHCAADQYSAQVELPHRAKVRYVCGYGDTATDVPAGVKIGLLMILSHRFEFRGDPGGGAANAS